MDFEEHRLIAFVILRVSMSWPASPLPLAFGCPGSPTGIEADLQEALGARKVDHRRAGVVALRDVEPAVIGAGLKRKLATKVDEIISEHARTWALKLLEPHVAEYAEQVQKRNVGANIMIDCAKAHLSKEERESKGQGRPVQGKPVGLNATRDIISQHEPSDHAIVSAFVQIVQDSCASYGAEDANSKACYHAHNMGHAESTAFLKFLEKNHRQFIKKQFKKFKALPTAHAAVLQAHEENSARYVEASLVGHLPAGQQAAELANFSPNEIAQLMDAASDQCSF